MDLGIHQLFLTSELVITKEDLAEYRELGLKWAKWPLSVGRADNGGWLREDHRYSLEQVRAIGMEPLLDIRTSAEDIEWLGTEAQFALPEKAEDYHEDMRRANETAVAQVCDLIAAAVERHKDLCHEWEFWGEWLCPWVSAGAWDHGTSYPGLLQAVYRTIHEVQPEARVWLGGYGMDLTAAHIAAVCDAGAGRYFDVANWHPYFMEVRHLEKAHFEMTYAFWWSRLLLRQKGKDQPFAASEWGYPTHDPDVPEAVLTYLKSNVVARGIEQLTCAEAVEWYEQDLSLMEEWGFQAVMVHCLRDYSTHNRHWSNYCGLLTEDGRRKPTWGVVQKWAHRGQSHGVQGQGN